MFCYMYTKYHLKQEKIKLKKFISSKKSVKKQNIKKKAQSRTIKNEPVLWNKTNKITFAIKSRIAYLDSNLGF